MQVSIPLSLRVTQVTGLCDRMKRTDCDATSTVMSRYEYGFIRTTKQHSPLRYGNTQCETLQYEAIFSKVSVLYLV